jgi:hypothetical protein
MTRPVTPSDSYRQHLPQPRRHTTYPCSSKISNCNSSMSRSSNRILWTYRRGRKLSLLDHALPLDANCSLVDGHDILARVDVLNKVLTHGPSRSHSHDPPSHPQAHAHVRAHTHTHGHVRIHIIPLHVLSHFRSRSYKDTSTPQIPVVPVLRMPEIFLAKKIRQRPVGRPVHHNFASQARWAAVPHDKSSIRRPAADRQPYLPGAARIDVHINEDDTTSS